MQARFYYKVPLDEATFKERENKTKNPEAIEQGTTLMLGL